MNNINRLINKITNDNYIRELEQGFDFTDRDIEEIQDEQLYYKQFNRDNVEVNICSLF